MTVGDVSVISVKALVIILEDIGSEFGAFARYHMSNDIIFTPETSYMNEYFNTFYGGSAL